MDLGETGGARGRCWEECREGKLQLGMKYMRKNKRKGKIKSMQVKPTLIPASEEAEAGRSL